MPMMKIGKKVKLLRRRAHKTQAQIATNAKISRQTLDALENNREQNPSLETLAAVVAACGAKLGDLFPEKSSAAILIEREIEASQKEHAVLLRKLRQILECSRRRETILRAVIDQVYVELIARQSR